MILAALVVSFIIVLLVTPWMMKAALRFGFLDYPAERKLHLKPTPLLGGLGVFFGFWLGLWLSLFLSHILWNPEILGLLLGSLVIVGIGLIDDKKGMNPSVKFFGQIIASLMFIFFSQSVNMFSGNAWGSLILILWMVGLMNALNFLDNMDGLCGGISAIAALSFAALGYFTGNVYLFLFSLALTGSLLGFLKYNYSPAKIFLGDTGSMFCGFMLSALGIIFAKRNVYYLNHLVPVLILSYPIFDTSFVTFTRLKEGKKIYQGGRDHSSHRIMEMGIHPKLTVWGIYFICLVLGFMGVVVFFLLQSPLKVLIIAFAGFLLTMLGIHLHRNLAHIKQKALLLLGDVLAVNLLFLLVYWVRFESGIFPAEIVVPLQQYTAVAIWISLFWVNLFAILGLYDFDWDSSLSEIPKSIAKSVGLGMAIFVVLTLGPDYLLLKSWILLAIYALCLVFFLLIERSILTFWFKSLLIHGKVKRKAIIIGTGDNAQKLLKDIDSNKAYGYQVVGLIQTQSNNSQMGIGNSQVLGEIEDLKIILKEHKAHETLIALEPDMADSIGEAINGVNDIEVNFKIPIELSDMIRGYKTSKLYGGKFLKIYPQPMRAWEWGIKRLWDIVVSFLILLFSSPLLFLIWLVLKFKQKSAVIAKQVCLGKSGKEFKIHMFYLAELQTWLERFVRKTGMEKLPMLFSVLKGEMSFVGPQLVIGNNLMADFGCNNSFNVKPGFWSLSAPTNTNSQQQTNNMQQDLFYIENMSLWLDAKIFARGVFDWMKKVATNN